ncbi:hypothetical protein [Acidiphilium sp. PM]|uniref:hypothetical protein n=1 Tax=Acidiphilium sp. PM TaxID=1043206 RepID=UPI00058789CD|nr:hypothetical protein [Acidiphilium sp. PM]
MMAFSTKFGLTSINARYRCPFNLLNMDYGNNIQHTVEARAGGYMSQVIALVPSLHLPTPEQPRNFQAERHPMATLRCGYTQASESASERLVGQKRQSDRILCDRIRGTGRRNGIPWKAAVRALSSMK